VARVSLLLLILAASLLRASTAAAEPRDPGAVVTRASDMLAQGDTTGAIDLLEHSNLDQHSDARAYILLGKTWRERGTIDGRLRSQRVLEEGRTHFPRDIDLMLELGRTYFAQRFFPDAVGTLQHALDVDPKRCDARYLIGLYHYRNWKRLNSYTDDLDIATAAAHRMELRPLQYGGGETLPVCTLLARRHIGARSRPDPGAVSQRGVLLPLSRNARV